MQCAARAELSIRARVCARERRWLSRQPRTTVAIRFLRRRLERHLDLHAQRALLVTCLEIDHNSISSIAFNPKALQLDSV